MLSVRAGMKPDSRVILRATSAAPRMRGDDAFKYEQMRNTFKAPRLHGVGARAN
jgi:hypothetical protein